MLEYLELQNVLVNRSDLPDSDRYAILNILDHIKPYMDDTQYETYRAVRKMREPGSHTPFTDDADDI